MLAISLLRVVFDAWHSVAVDARRTKEYFEVSNKYSTCRRNGDQIEWSEFKP